MASKIKKKPQTRNIKLSDGTVVKANDNNKRILGKKYSYSRAVADPEDAPPPKDEWSKHEYPPPKNDPRFRARWGKFIDNVVGRSNFTPGHLS